jgi:hypothetical protein
MRLMHPEALNSDGPPRLEEKKKMKRVASLLSAVALISAGCGSSSTSPSNAPVVFTAQLLPSNEGFAINGGETSGSGNATISFNVTKDSGGTITSATANFDVTLTGFPATTNITIAHIHIGVVGSTPGTIVLNTGLAGGQVTLTNGAGGFQKLGINFDPALAQQIIDNPAGYYFNVHSSANPVGVARGQLVKQ